MILDGHIHLWNGPDHREKFLQKLRLVGIDGGILISLPPAAFTEEVRSGPARVRLENLLHWSRPSPNLYPFFWIDPLERDAADQVSMAIDQGVMGFKIICDRFEPGDRRVIKILRRMGRAGKPVLFHSGILWDGKPSSIYNRPAGFEAFLEVDGLRFSLAHISWPWCDELIAVYGKFLNSYTRRPDLSVEMFIDITPGTPPIYREEALRKLFTVGYDVENNVIFGSDCMANRFNVDGVRQWMKRDGAIYKKLGIKKKTLQKIYSENLKRFLGLSSLKFKKQLPRPGE